MGATRCAWGGSWTALPLLALLAALLLQGSPGQAGAEEVAAPAADAGAAAQEGASPGGVEAGEHASGESGEEGSHEEGEGGEEEGHHESGLEEGEGDEEEEGHHESGPEGVEEEITDVDIGMAWMLLGSVSVAMAIFYLVNWPDDDIRRYSWQILSSTISIFMGVMIYEAIDDFLTTMMPPQSSLSAVLSKLLLFLVFFVVLQACIAITSGAVGEAVPPDLNKEVWCYADFLNANCGFEAPAEAVRPGQGRKSVAVEQGVEIFVEKVPFTRQARVRQMRAYATLFAKISGFAAINTGRYAMHWGWFSSHWLASCFMVILTQVFLYLLFHSAKQARTIVGKLYGKMDDRHQMFNIEVTEAENDIYSLSGSFLTVQVLVFALSGKVPSLALEEQLAEASPGNFAVFAMFTWGAVFGVLAIYLPDIVMRSTGRNVCPMHIVGSIHRAVELLQNEFAMVSAWAVSEGVRWLVSSSNVTSFVGGPHAMGGRILVALVLSLLSLLIIGCLDKIEDHAKSTGADVVEVSKVVRSAISSLAILIGFSWEYCFIGGAEALASLTSAPAVTKLGLAGIIALGIVPAWRQYILGKVIAYTREHTEAAAVDMRSARTGEHTYDALGRQSAVQPVDVEQAVSGQMILID